MFNASVTLLLLFAAGALAQLPQHRLTDDDAVSFLEQFDHTGFTLDLRARRLVQFSERAGPVCMSEAEKIHAKMDGKRFFDVTDTPELESNAHLVAFTRNTTYPKPNRTDAVKRVIETLSTDGLVENLKQFTSFRTRHYCSDTGRQSQLWLLGNIKEYTQILASEGMRSLITVEEFVHPWGQNTIIARIPGFGADADEVVILSAHLDSTNVVPYLPAPGADDDGSGTVTILEAYRGLLVSDFRPTRTVEFHWYAAEEGGHLGSQAVARDYQQRSVRVYAQTQFDMTAWIKPGTREEIGIVTDYVHPALAQFLRELVDAYIDIPYADTVCGYASSDHASWDRAGYPASYVFEGKFTSGNRHAHTADDQMDIAPEFSFAHMLHFVKLAAAISVELGGSD